ncbi:MAG: cobalamin-dependent protein [Candidatus Nitricoxidivorans perseverans]|uniref:Cobalamin-dependent protein n=1 Tax=Candidatus Nitricoxidivorans perseverans TaxID=2975601 RepID=A0AA49FNJ8_9PROT|nr:MAG: cobalamin-dependent protein [Candidatus Nitricoxidivorans perseverans]
MVGNTVSVVDFRPLIDTLLAGDHAAALAETRRLREAGVGAERIVTDGLEAAMGRLDDKCTIEQFNLLEIMLVGRAVSVVIRELYPEGLPPKRGRATFVIATLEGDVHDLGKNIVRMVLIGKGYRVVDIGRDCPLDALVAAAEREHARAVLVSGLISTIVPQVRRIRGALRARGLDGVEVVAGGAALKQLAPDELNVDYVAETAFDGARYLDSLAVPEVQP